VTSNKVLITGAGGFIGARVMAELSDLGVETLGLDNFSTYYSPNLKTARLQNFNLANNVLNIDISDEVKVEKIFKEFKPSAVINLAAQGGVRASKVDPRPYILTNQLGFLNILECSRKYGVKDMIYASSSSVYGDGLVAPFDESSALPEFKSLYALSKFSNEIISKYYPIGEMSLIGLRFFTVYGPWGRPDMAVFRLLASSRLERPFNLTANLDISRDFTYVDDVVSVVSKLLEANFISPISGVLNVAGSKPRSLRDLFQVASNLGIQMKIEKHDADPLDAQTTNGSTTKLERFGLPIPTTSLEIGISKTWDWINNCDLSSLERWYDHNT
jgi:UDP-glucuronate 4-epimerase